MMLDVEPLLDLSIRDSLDDCFGDVLDGSNRLFADSDGTADLDEMLAERKEAAYAELESASLEPISFNGARFDVAAPTAKDPMPSSYGAKIDAALRSAYRPRAAIGRKARRRGSTGSLLTRFRARSDIDFDPPAQHCSHKRRQGKVRQAPKKRRRVTFDSATTKPPNLSYLLGRAHNVTPQQRDPPENSAFQNHHSLALRKFAASMNRTERSRRQLSLQLGDSSEKLIGEKSALSRSQLQRRCSLVTGFFAGSRGTLTEGLEQSRRQIKAYVDRVASQACM